MSSLLRKLPGQKSGGGLLRKILGQQGSTQSSGISPPSPDVDRKVETDGARRRRRARQPLGVPLTPLSPRRVMRS